MGDSERISVSGTESIQQLDPVEQSVRFIRIAIRITRSSTQACVLDRYPNSLRPPLDAREFGRMAVRLSIRHGLPAIFVRHNARERAQEPLAFGMGGVYFLIGCEHVRDVAVSLDRLSEVISGRWPVISCELLRNLPRCMRCRRSVADRETNRPLITDH